MNDPMAPTCKPTYPNDIPPEQIEGLISGVTSLQSQVLRRFAQSVLEEMRYHFYISQEKCKEYEAECNNLKTISYHLGEDKKELQKIAIAAKNLYAESEEYDFPDGMGKGALQEHWDNLANALDVCSDD
jgi:hypothetical protein